MLNRFGTEIKRYDIVSYHTSRGEVRAGIVLKFYRISGCGWRVDTAGGSCGVDDVIRIVARELLRKGCPIEVGTGAPGYRWVQGWQVFDPQTGAWSVEVRRVDALKMASDIRREWGQS